MIPQGAFITKVSPKLINTVSWVGTVCLLMGPYLMHMKIGFILAAVGVIGISPAIYIKKQWNLILLNASSVIAYSLQIFNII